MITVTTFHYPDQRQDRHDHPDEDFLAVSGNCFALFDGISLIHQKPYPDPSPAAIAAKIAATSVCQFIQHNNNLPDKLRMLKQAFQLANQRVKEYNQSLGITPDTVDFLGKQYAACVGTFGFIDHDTLYFTQLHDTGVMAFDQFGNRELDFIINGSAIRSYIQKLGEQGIFEPGSAAEHQYVRKNMVNHPELFDGANRVGFGVMSGEEQAEAFLRLGSFTLLEKQTILLYSDGFIPFVYDQEFVDLIHQTEDQDEIDSFITYKIPLDEKYQKEKSLIIIRHQLVPPVPPPG